MSGRGSGASRPRTSRPTSSTSRGGTASCATPERGCRRASSYLEQAIAAGSRDTPWPTRAWPRRTSTSAWASSGSYRRRGLPAPGRPTARALALDRELAEAHACGATSRRLRLRLGRRRGGVQARDRAQPEQCGRLRHLRPLLSALGTLRRGDRRAARAHELDPLSNGWTWRPRYLRAGRNEEALRAATRGWRSSRTSPLAHATLGWAHCCRGEARKGLPRWSAPSELSPDKTLYRAQLGQAYACVGQTEQARRILRQLEELSRSATSRPITWPTSTPASATTNGRWTGWSGRTANGPAASSGSRARFCSRRSGASALPGPAREAEPGLSLPAARRPSRYRYFGPRRRGRQSACVVTTSGA